MKLELMIGIALLALSCQRKADPPAPAGDAGAPNVEVAQPAAEPEDYHTKHLDDAGKPKYRNALVGAASPHLRRHAYQPVDWYPWDSTAMTLVRAQRRPILLAIGDGFDVDSAVLSDEMWDDESTGKALRERYVAIKVDRNERPDLAVYYAAAAQRLAGRVAWPLTLVLTPDGDPLAALPGLSAHREIEGGLPTFVEKWAPTRASEREALDKAAKATTSALVQQFEARGKKSFRAAKGARTAAVGTYESTYDETNAGWGPQKAPLGPQLRFLLRADDVSKRSLTMVTETLDALRMSPVHDHVGGGFFEGATDGAWTQPRLQKTLATNAMLLLVYTEAYQATKSPAYAEVVRGIVAFMERDLRAEQGGYFAGLAAPQGESAGYYSWTAAQLDEASAKLAEAFALTETGLLRRTDASADANQDLKDAVSALRKVRESRPAPDRDEAVIAAWNGLATSALARAGFVFDEPVWLDAAGFATRGLPVQEGALRRQALGETMGPPALGDDYAYAIDGLVSLFEATADSGFLRRAALLQNQMDVACLDPAGAAYFLTPVALAGDLAVRLKLVTDGVLPSVNGAAASNLWRLGTMRADAALTARLDSLLDEFGGVLASEPAVAPSLLTAAQWRERGTTVAVVGKDLHAMLEVLRDNFFPFIVFARSTDKPIVPWLAEKESATDKGAAFVCRGANCSRAIAEPAALRDELRSR